MRPTLPELHERTLPAAFERALAASPDAIAHVDSAAQWTYVEAFDRSRRLAGGLTRLGLGPDAPVAALLDNSNDAAHLFFGLGLTRRIQVPINTAYKGRFLSHIINDCQADTLVVESGYCSRLAAISQDVPKLSTVIIRGDLDEGVSELPAGRFRVVPFDELTAANPDPVGRTRPWDVQAYFYTSGTTGVSKGVVVPHGQAYTYASREDDPRASANDRTLVVLPLFHLAGQMYGVYQSLISRGRCVLEPVFSLGTFWDVVRTHQINNTVLLGAMAQLVYQQEPQPDDVANPLELVLMAPLVADVVGFAKRFGVEVGSVYGGTEFGCPIVGHPETIVGGECGYPRDGFECRVVDEHDVELSTGEVGELVVRATHPWTMSNGYVNLPEATLSSWRNQWMHTGDAFRVDETGRFFFVDRVKDALRRRGENVSSFEVEQVINEHPQVMESAVVAVPSQLSEDDIKAVIVPRGEAELNPAELIRFLAPRLPYFMVPRFVEIVADMPRTPTQKIQKVRLREAGITDSTWDREAAGIAVTRND